MTTHTLTINLKTASLAALGDTDFRITLASTQSVIAVDDDVIVPIDIDGTTDSNGVASVDLLSSADIGTDYLLEVSADASDDDLAQQQRSSIRFTMPAEDSTLAAAIGYTATGQAVALPVHGWQFSETPPASPSAGDGWYRPSTGVLSVRRGGDWVGIGGAGGAPDLSGYVTVADYNAAIGDIENDHNALVERVTTAETTLAQTVTSQHSQGARLTTAEDDIDALETSVASAATTTALEAETTARTAADTALGERIDNLPTASGGQPDITVSLLHTLPSDPDEGDWFVQQLSTETDSPTKIARVWDGTGWHIPTAFLGNRGATNATSHELTYGQAVDGEGAVHNDVLAYHGTSGTNLVWPSTEPLSAVRTDVDAATTTAGQAAADAATAQSAITSETSARTAAIDEVSNRVAALEEAQMAGGQQGVNATALRPRDADVTIEAQAGLGSDLDVHEFPAVASDGGDTALPVLASDSVNGQVLRNTSTEIVAGVSVLTSGFEAGESAFVLAKLNVGTQTRPYWHTLFGNAEVAAFIQADDTNNRARVQITPASGSSTTIDIPIDIASVGDFAVGIQFTDTGSADVTANVAVNGTTTSAATTITGLASLSWNTTLNLMCGWQTALLDTPSTNTFHVVGDIWDIVVGRKGTAWSHADFAALTDITDTLPSNRTQLYDGAFVESDAPYYSSHIQWSERIALPGATTDDATVHQLRTFIPAQHVTEYFVDARATNQSTHNPETTLGFHDTARARYAFIDLGDQTIGGAGIAADVTIDRAQVDTWIRADQGFTLTQSRHHPVWSLSSGWSSNTTLDFDEFTTWGIALVRHDATNAGVPAGRANAVCVVHYIGADTSAAHRSIRIGVRA